MLCWAWQSLSRKDERKGKGERIKDEKLILYVSHFILDSFAFIRTSTTFRGGIW